MIHAVQRYLAPACEQVLETMFFTGILSAQEQTSLLGEGCISATVGFEGPPDGYMRISMATQTAAALASSFLGREPESLDPADCSGVAGELANMICGALLSHYAEESEFHLAAPVLEQGVPPSPDDEHSVRASLELPEGALDVYVRVDRPQSPPL